MRYVIGFSRRMHFFAKAIMFFTRSEVSHVYIRQEGQGVDYVLEAAHRGVDLQWYEVFQRNKTIIVHEFEVNHPIEDLNRAWEKICYERLNLKYGWTTIIGDAYVYLMFWLTKKWVKNPFPAPWQDVCSELALAWLVEAKIPGFDELDPSIAPSDNYSTNPGILEMVREKPEVFMELNG